MTANARAEKLKGDMEDMEQKYPSPFAFESNESQFALRVDGTHVPLKNLFNCPPNKFMQNFFFEVSQNNLKLMGDFPELVKKIAKMMKKTWGTW